MANYVRQEATIQSRGHSICNKMKIFLRLMPLIRFLVKTLRKKETPFMLCALILYMSGGTYSLKSTSNDRFSRNFSWHLYLFSEFLPEIC